MYHNESIVIATKHGKEKVIAKHFESEFEVKCFVEKNYDTDIFGTFSGEVARTLSPVDTLRAKCLQAMEHYGYNFGIANEGSFGPHPGLFFIPADEELMIYIDKLNEIEVIVKHISTHTNFNGKIIKDENELDVFLNQVYFPSHYVILRKSKEENECIIKDINNYKELLLNFQKMKNLYNEVYIETDMRAMHNPMRLLVIEEATLKLIAAIKSKCPKCKTPGFIPTKIKPGLPCKFCGLPTKSIKLEVYKCKKCSYEYEKMYPKNKQVEDPQFCDYCNP